MPGRHETRVLSVCVCVWIVWILRKPNTQNQTRRKACVGMPSTHRPVPPPHRSCVPPGCISQPARTRAASRTAVAVGAVAVRAIGGRWSRGCRGRGRRSGPWLSEPKQTEPGAVAGSSARGNRTGSRLSRGSLAVAVGRGGLRQTTHGWGEGRAPGFSCESGPLQARPVRLWCGCVWRVWCLVFECLVFARGPKPNARRVLFCSGSSGQEF